MTGPEILKAMDKGSALQEETGGDCVSRLVRHSLTLDEFIFEQLKSLEDFESSWRELHRKNDEIYPLEMFAGDWSEQLAFWREHETQDLAQCPHCGSQKDPWFSRVIPMNYHCQDCGKDVDATPDNSLHNSQPNKQKLDL